jgi:hypothetical protein
MSDKVGQVEDEVRMIEYIQHVQFHPSYGYTPIFIKIVKLGVAL